MSALKPAPSSVQTARAADALLQAVDVGDGVEVRVGVRLGLEGDDVEGAVVGIDLNLVPGGASRGTSS